MSISVTMETEFINMYKHVVEQIFNNWKGLQLAVEHMGGPLGKQTALEIMEWITQYCLEQTELNVPDITEALEDLLDEEFDTIFEDDSTREVATLLVKFLQLLRDQNMDQFEMEFKNIPNCEIWLSKEQTTIPVERQQNIPVEHDSSDSNDVEMDPEWTVVQNRRRR